MLDADDAEVCKPVMIGTEGNQVGTVIASTIGPRRDVMHVRCQVEAADNTSVAITDAGLRLKELCLAALPVGIIDAVDKVPVVLMLAVAIAIVVLTNLARVQTQFCAARRARNDALLLASGRRRQALPGAVARIFATGSAFLLFRGPHPKRFLAHGTDLGSLAAAIVAVMRASVLVVVDVVALLAWIPGTGNFLTTAARAEDDARSAHISLSNHLSKSIILAC